MTLEMALDAGSSESLSREILVLVFSATSRPNYRDRRFEHGIELDVHSELSKEPHAVRIRDLCDDYQLKRVDALREQFDRKTASEVNAAASVSSWSRPRAKARQQPTRQ